MRAKLTEDIQRLRDMDTAMRADGINVPQLAKEWEVTERTVHRYLETLRELVGPTEAVRGDDNRVRQSYSGKPVRLFAKGA